MSKYSFSTVAITGITGTLGCALVRECIANNIEVVAFIHPNSVNEKRIPDHSLIKKVYCSLDEMNSVDVSGIKADVFIHLAWGSTNRQERNQIAPQVDNIKYAIDSVALAERLGCTVYVGAGSQAEYGNTSEVITETTVTKPVTAYGIAKLCAGQMTRLECKNRGIRHIWPRIFSTYGPYTQDTTIINSTISSLLKKQKPTLTLCEQVWDFLYVDDAARALLFLAENGANGEIYCVASGYSMTLKEYLEIICKHFGDDIELGYGDIPYNENTVMHLAGDIAKIQALGFEPAISFEEGAAKTISWAKEYYE